MLKILPRVAVTLVFCSFSSTACSPLASEADTDSETLSQVSAGQKRNIPTAYYGIEGLTDPKKKCFGTTHYYYPTAGQNSSSNTRIIRTSAPMKFEGGDQVILLDQVSVHEIKTNKNKYRSFVRLGYVGNFMESSSGDVSRFYTCTVDRDFFLEKILPNKVPSVNSCIEIKNRKRCYNGAFSDSITNGN